LCGNEENRAKELRNGAREKELELAKVEGDTAPSIKTARHEHTKTPLTIVIEVGDTS
jgi:hypothetical protein